MIPQRTRPASRGLLFQSEVRSVLVIVGDVIREKSLQMSLVQRDCVVEQLTATAANPALSHSILPRTSNRSTHRCDLQRANSAGHFEPVVVRKNSVGAAAKNPSRCNIVTFLPKRFGAELLGLSKMLLIRKGLASDGVLANHKHFRSTNPCAIASTRQFLQCSAK